MATEKRLIDANALSERIGNMKFEITHNRGGYRYCNEDEKNEWDKLDSFDSLVCDAPTVDAVEVVHAEWLDIRFDSMWRSMLATCSQCKVRGEVRVKSNECGFAVPDSDYCPHCGAKMDGGSK